MELATHSQQDGSQLNVRGLNFFLCAMKFMPKVYYFG